MFQSKRGRTFAAMCVILLPLCLARQVLGATPDWAAVQGLAAGARVHVILTTGKNLNGVIDHVTAEAVYLHSRKQTIEVRREEIGRLYRKKDPSRIKPVLVGAAMGAPTNTGLIRLVSFFRYKRPISSRRTSMVCFRLCRYTASAVTWSMTPFRFFPVVRITCTRAPAARP